MIIDMIIGKIPSRCAEYARWELRDGGHYSVWHPSARIDFPEDHLERGEGLVAVVVYVWGWRDR